MIKPSRLFLQILYVLMYIDVQIVELYRSRFNLRGGDGETLASSWCGIILWLYSNLPSFKTNSKLHTLLFTTTRTPHNMAMVKTRIRRRGHGGPITCVGGVACRAGAGVTLRDMAWRRISWDFSSHYLCSPHHASTHLPLPLHRPPPLIARLISSLKFFYHTPSHC